MYNPGTRVCRYGYDHTDPSKIGTVANAIGVRDLIFLPEEAFYAMLDPSGKDITDWMYFTYADILRMQYFIKADGIQTERNNTK